MHTRLSLRFRVFLFFCLLAFGGLAVFAGALWAGYQRAAIPEASDAFLFSGLLGSFALFGLCTVIWLLFDRNMARPIERLAAQMRVQAHTPAPPEVDTHSARYLGDLAYAAEGLAGQLGKAAMDSATAIARETEHLETEKTRLTALLSELPVATIQSSPGHRIVLYDSQAAAALRHEAPPRLNASLFEYFDRIGLEAAHSRLSSSGLDVTAEVKSADGGRSYDLRLKPLGEGLGYLLILEGAHGEAEPKLVYDFGLLSAETGETAGRPLSDLCYVVLDTKTTGTLPHKDEIMQIAACRVVRGRIVGGEEFSTLVDPGRPVPEKAARIHGMTSPMTADAPGIAEAARQLHRFASGSVIVAHNAPFDMAFLRRHSTRSGVTWDQPVVDLVLLSRILFGPAEKHTLNEIGSRLGVLRSHSQPQTATSGARYSAEILCKMLPMLQARGFTTFDLLAEELRNHGGLPGGTN